MYYLEIYDEDGNTEDRIRGFQTWEDADSYAMNFLNLCFEDYGVFYDCYATRFED